MPIAIKKSMPKEKKNLAPRSRKERKLEQKTEAPVERKIEETVSVEPRRVLENKYLLETNSPVAGYLKFVRSQIKMGMKVNPVYDELAKNTVQRFIGTVVEKGQTIFEKEVVNEEVNNRGFEVKIL